VEQYPNTGQNPNSMPPQPNYPGTTPFGQPPTGAGTPPVLATPPASPRKNNRIVAAAIVVAVVVLLVIGGVVHINSATGTVKGFYDDLFSFNYTSAFARICPDKQSALKAEFDAAETALNQVKSQATFDSSKLVYTLKSGGVTTAVVAVSGTLGATLGGVKNSSPITNTDIALNASGLGWCLNVLPSAGASPNS
jgi:heme A synthase